MFIWVGAQNAARAQAENDVKAEAERLEQIRLAAVEDAQALTAASDNALAASDTFHTDVQLALTYLKTTAIPVRDVISGATEEFGEGHEGEISAAIEVLSDSLEPPVLSPQSTETAAVAHADASPAPDESVEPTPEPDATPLAVDSGTDPWGITVEYLGTDAERHAGELHRHYGELDAQARDVARGAIVTEIGRFADLGTQFIEASSALALHVENVDRTIQHALAAASEVGATTQGDVGEASDEALEELQVAIDALEALTELEVTTEWESRTPEEPSALVGVVDVVNGYLSATEAARSSHEANRAPEPYICYAYRWGGPHPTYCWG